jgi:arginine decarboxylase
MGGQVHARQGEFGVMTHIQPPRGSGEKAPLYEAIYSYINRQPSRCHVPGHRGGSGLTELGGTELYGLELIKAMMNIDLTEVSGLDDLHQPSGAIMEAQQLAAKCFGAEETHFLVGGSTVGNQALIMALCRPGDLLLVQRNVHKSVIHALMLAGARAVFLPPRIDSFTGVPAGIQYSDIEEALSKYPDAVGVFITNPNYYGLGVDIRRIAEICHRFDKPLLVDEAHGAHYGFHPTVPESAMQCGADAAVQSTHKMLTALTMGAMLHIQGARIPRMAVKRMLTILQSSSPSYPILASLDVSRLWISRHGFAWIERGAQLVNELVHEIRRLGRYQVGFHPVESAFYETKDPFKVTIRDASATLNGFQLRAALEEEGCFPEMADADHVLLAFSLAAPVTDVRMVVQAFERIMTRFPPVKEELQDVIPNKDIVVYSLVMSEPVSFSLWNTSDSTADLKVVPLAEAAGQISDEMVTPYPPGVPVLYPGEMISPAMISGLLRLADAGASFQGVSDPTLQTVRIRAISNKPANRE